MFVALEHRKPIKETDPGSEEPRSSFVEDISPLIVVLAPAHQAFGKNVKDTGQGSPGTGHSRSYSLAGWPQTDHWFVCHVAPPRNKDSGKVILGPPPLAEAVETLFTSPIFFLWFIKQSSEVSAWLYTPS